MLTRFSSKSLLIAVVLGALVLTLGLLPRGAGAQADCSGPDCVEVPAGATLGGGSGAAMTIECKWELPDMSVATAGMTYEEDNLGIYDDTPSELADGPACDPSLASCPNGRRHMMGITPNPDDQPIQRQYEKWVAVESANVSDIVDVYWKVWEPYVALAPNGPNCAAPVTFPVGNPPESRQFCFKYQHHATATQGPPTTGNPLGSGGTMFAASKGNCGDLTSGAQAKMLEAAVGTGQMTQAEATGAGGIVDKCLQGEKAIFRVRETVSKEQSYGEYRVEVTIVNSAGTTVQNVNFFDVLPFIHMVKDFTAVDWQTIVNNSTTIVSGDQNLEPEGIATADGSGVKPTIKNLGNQEMFVNVHFDPLILDSDPTKNINRFDTKFRAGWKLPTDPVQVFDPVYASTWVCFDLNPLGANDTGKLDFSVHPENAQQGHYTGSIDVLGSGGTCD